MDFLKFSIKLDSVGGLKLTVFVFYLRRAYPRKRADWLYLSVEGHAEGRSRLTKRVEQAFDREIS